MATGLPIGEFRWTQRWSFPEDLQAKPERLLNAKPVSEMFDASQIENPVARTSSVARRPEVGRTYETEFDRNYGQASAGLEKTVVAGIPRKVADPRTRGRGVRPAPSDYTHHHATTYWHVPEDRAGNIPFEKRTQRLWGRINAAHTSMPMQTTSQTDFVDYPDEKEPLKPDHRLVVRNKPYIEAHFIALNTQQQAKAKPGASG